MHPLDLPERDLRCERQRVAGRLDDPLCDGQRGRLVAAFVRRQRRLGGTRRCRELGLGASAGEADLADQIRPVHASKIFDRICLWKYLKIGLDLRRFDSARRPWRDGLGNLRRFAAIPPTPITRKALERRVAMSVSECLGVADVDGSLMLEARLGWGRWCAAHPTLGVVANLLDLPTWTKAVDRAERDRVVALLARLAREDHAAAIALAWLLCPAASLVAARLADRSGDIDGLVAGQMWVELTGGARTYERSVAANIIRAVQDAVRADLGVGRASARSDPAWSRTAVVAELPELAYGLFGPPSELDSSETLSAVVQQAVRREIITTAEADLADEVTLAIGSDERLRLLDVDLLAPSNHVLGVVGPTLDLAALQQTFHDLFRVDDEYEHGVELVAGEADHGVELVDLREGAGVAVEQEALFGVGLADAGADHPVSDLVGHVLSGIHEALGLEAKGGALGDVATEDVAGGDGRDTEAIGDVPRLSAFARAGRPDDQCAHQRPAAMASSRATICCAHVWHSFSAFMPIGISQKVRQGRSALRTRSERTHRVGCARCPTAVDVRQFEAAFEVRSRPNGLGGLVHVER